MDKRKAARRRLDVKRGIIYSSKFANESDWLSSQQGDFGQSLLYLRRFPSSSMQITSLIPFDYQSECHCSKTVGLVVWKLAKFDYQSECHCSKTHCAIGRLNCIVELCGFCPELDVGFPLGHGRSLLNIRYTYAIVELLNGGGSRCSSVCL